MKRREVKGKEEKEKYTNLNAEFQRIERDKKCKKVKWLSEAALQMAEKRREAKGQGEKGR